ncbi:hypothetical protein M885DRAFT_579948 [Pelagophyceae sp. CCMP2097]|nr:hypothetical protein M885DRAFT_579948 [Pelagophyceae sp. CCMP2097]
MNRGISGGERKRLMVCQEMLTEPRLLCCDEPTSGLDSSTAVVVVEAFRRLAFQKRVACVSAIHQPSSRIFTLFDTLVLLDKGGTVYQGPTKDAGAAFANAPFDLPCPASYSAPDWLMDCVVRGDLSTVDGPVMACRLSSEETKEAFVTKEASVKDQTAMRCDALRHRYGADSLPGPPRLRKLRVAYKNAYAAKLSEHVSVLSARAWLDVWPAFIDRNAWVLHAGEGALAGFMWYQLQYRARPRLANPQRPSERDIFARVTLAFFLPITWVFFPLLDSLAAIPAAELMLRKELSVAAYPLGAWLLPMVLHAAVHVALVFAITNLSQDIVVFLAQYAAVVLALFTFQSIGLFFSAALPPRNLMTTAMLYVSFCFLYTGLYYILNLGIYVAFAIDRHHYKCFQDADDGTSYPDSCVGPDAKGYVGVSDILREYNVRRLHPATAIIVLLAMAAAARATPRDQD